MMYRIGDDTQLLRELIYIYVICRDNEDYKNVMYTISRIAMEMYGVPLNIKLEEVKDFPVRVSV